MGKIHKDIGLRQGQLQTEIKMLRMLNGYNISKVRTKPRFHRPWFERLYGHSRDDQKQPVVMTRYNTFNFAESRAYIRTYRQVDHINVAKILDYEERADGTLVLIEEGLNVSLKDYIKQETPNLTMVDARNIFKQIIKGADIMLQNEILSYIDVNDVRMAADGTVKISQVNARRSYGVHNSVNSGRTHFLAPEQLENDGNFDAEKSVVFSVGLLLLYFCTGKSPPRLVSSFDHNIELQDLMTFIPPKFKEAERVILGAVKYDPDERMTLNQLDIHLRSFTERDIRQHFDCVQKHVDGNIPSNRNFNTCVPKLNCTQVTAVRPEKSDGTFSENQRKNGVIGGRVQDRQILVASPELNYTKQDRRNGDRETTGVTLAQVKVDDGSRCLIQHLHDTSKEVGPVGQEILKTDKNGSRYQRSNKTYRTGLNYCDDNNN